MRKIYIVFRELAKRGHRKFLLISRSQAKLDALAKELHEEFGVTSKTLAFDFDSHEYEALNDFIGALEGPIGILGAPFALLSLVTSWWSN